MTRNFRELLEGRWSKRCFVCVGLDSDRSKIPDRFLNDGELGKQLAFNKWIIDQTHEVACAFKPNSAFYEAEGDEGARVLQRTIEYANRVAPDDISVEPGARLGRPAAADALGKQGPSVPFSGRKARIP